MKRKPIAILVIVALILMTLCACGSPESSGTSPITSAPNTQPSGTSTGDPGGKVKTLSFAYLARGLESQWPLDVAASYEKLSKERGFKITVCDAELSAEKQMNQVDEMITKGVDAIFLLIVDEGMAQAIADRCAEAGVLLIGESIPIMDSGGHFVAPMVMLDAYNCGYECAKWIGENYEALGFDFGDLSKVGFFAAGDSRLQNDMARVEGANASIKDNIPGFPEKNFFFADVAADAASDALQASFNQASAIIAANPQIEYWLSVPVMEEDAVGVCRAMEAAGFAEKGIISSVGGERAVLSWPDGQREPWYACNYFHGMYAAEQIVDAAYKVLQDGVPATEVFKPEEGQTYGYKTFSGTMCTFENYKDFVVKLD